MNDGHTGTRSLNRRFGVTGGDTSSRRPRTEDHESLLYHSITDSLRVAPRTVCHVCDVHECQTGGHRSVSIPSQSRGRTGDREDTPGPDYSTTTLSCET